MLKLNKPPKPVSEASLELYIADLLLAKEEIISTCTNTHAPPARVTATLLFPN